MRAIAISAYSSSSLWVGTYGATLTTKVANLDIVIIVNYSTGDTIRFTVINPRMHNGSLDIDLEFRAGTDAEGNVMHEDADDYVNDNLYVPGDSGVFDFLGSQGADTDYFDLLGTGILSPVSNKCYQLSCTRTSGETICVATEVPCS